MTESRKEHIHCLRMLGYLHDRCMLDMADCRRAQEEFLQLTGILRKSWIRRLGVGYWDPAIWESIGKRDTERLRKMGLLAHGKGLFDQYFIFRTFQGHRFFGLTGMDKAGKSVLWSGNRGKVVHQVRRELPWKQVPSIMDYIKTVASGDKVNVVCNLGLA